MAERPDTINGWPVRWVRRGQADDGKTTIGGLTAVIDGARVGSRGRLRIRDSAYVQGVVLQVGRDDLDGQPLDALDDVAETMLREWFTAKLEISDV